MKDPGRKLIACMKRFNCVVAVLLTYVLCASALLQPVSVYAASAAGEGAGSVATEQSNSSEEADESADQPEGQGEEEQEASVQEDQNESQIADSDDVSGDAETTDQDSSASEESEANDSAASYKANSWRYIDGELRNDIRDDNASEANFYGRAMHRMPDGATAQGIDVSGLQGDIDWQKVKDAGIDYAIIKIGSRDNNGWWTDSRFLRNVSECERLGIPWGAYVYSYARNATEATEEADFAVSKLSGHHPTLPIYFDLEETPKEGESIKWLPYTDSAAMASIAKAFCNRISSAGYKPGIYASAGWFKYYLTDPCFSNSGWSIWTAQYWYDPYNASLGLAPEYPAKFDCWQYSYRGSIPGISGDVDVDYWYGTLPSVSDSEKQLGYYKPVFDPDYYLANNSDVKDEVGDDEAAALNHFLNIGMYEGRCGCESFDVQSYYNEYSDLRSAYGTSIKDYYLHYIKYGQKEGRHAVGCSELIDPLTKYDGVDYSPVYDPLFYIGNNNDLKTAFSKTYGSIELIDFKALLRHFVSCGMSEGRATKEGFDLTSYYYANEDLRAAYGLDLKRYYRHYVDYGRKEGRVCTGVDAPTTWAHSCGGVDYSPVYDGSYYRQNNPDLQTAFLKKAGGLMLYDDVALLRHFVSCGMSEGRATKEGFDLTSYYYANEDLRAAYGLDLKRYYRHYVDYGRKEGRVCTGVDAPTTWAHSCGGVDYSPVYDGSYYRQNNPDLQTAFLKKAGGLMLYDDVALLRHFVSCGANEGRRGNSSFDVHSYYNEYSDLRKIYRENYIQYYKHYCLYGRFEGRHASGCNQIVGYHGFQNPVGYYYVDSASVKLAHQSGIFGYASPSRLSDTATKADCINAMITRAYDYVGTTPYIWDYSCAPGIGVDCAGLVMQCLYATGMDLGRYTPWDHYYTPGHDHYANDMWNDSRFYHLPFSQRQRGDLICYNGHIAIYIGNDLIIEASSPRNGVRVHSVYVGYSIKGVLRPFI